jgi:hypothetical protein
MSYAQKLAVLDEIRVKPTFYDQRKVKGTVSIRSGSMEKSFEVIYSYNSDIVADWNIAGLLMAMPAVNFTLFAKRLVLDFPASKWDVDHIRDFVRINNREVFVNKLARRRYEFFRKAYLPGEDDITEENSNGITEVVSTSVLEDMGEPDVEFRKNAVAVLSSGGKESLLSYGMLREAGAETHAFYFNESGSHWFTASTAYAYYSSNFGNVHKVWSNVDRLYRFFLRNLEPIDQEAIKKKTDTYPVQLFIFPVYAMALVPVALKHGISSMVLGDEFDDPREMPPYRGIRHYFGIYDQTHDFNSYMSEYLSGKGIPLRVWSAVYPVTGSVVENVLVKRYPELFRLQRSCHSCRSVDGNMVPCGRCSKCMGIIMFVLAANGDPTEIQYRKETLENLSVLIEKERMRLDTDELNFMKGKLNLAHVDLSALMHVDGIHILPDETVPFEKVPEYFRSDITGIISQYSGGAYILKDGQWLEKGA